MIVPYPKPNPNPFADPGGICWGQSSGGNFSVTKYMIWNNLEETTFADNHCFLVLFSKKIKILLKKKTTLPKLL